MSPSLLRDGFRSREEILNRANSELVCFHIRMARSLSSPLQHHGVARGLIAVLKGVEISPS